MRKILIFALLLSAAAAMAAKKTVEVFTLDHQMSEMCQKKITENLRFEKGISRIDVSLKENTITITYDAEKTGTEKILAAFRKIGFNAAVVKGGKPESGACCSKEAAAQSCCKQHEQPSACCKKKPEAVCCRKEAAPSAGCQKKGTPAACCKK